MGTDEQDAQRDLEQKALRNVRNLVDRIETEDRKATNPKKTIAVVIVVLLVAAIAGSFVVGRSKEAVKAGPSIELPPPTKPVTK
jgi:hypothetical protein